MDLYHNDMSTCSQKVRLVLAEKDLRPVEHHLNLRAGDQIRPEYLKLNPNGVVPTLVDRGVAIIESTVICEYLDDAYPQVSLRPADPLLRAQMRRWTMQPDSGLHQAVGVSSMAVTFRHQFIAKGAAHIEHYLQGVPDPGKREHMRTLIEQGLDAPGVAQAIRRFARFVDDLERQLQQTPWLAGDAFSLADAMAIPYVLRLEHLSYNWWWRGSQRPRPAVTEWLARCKQRPSYRGIADYIDAAYVELLQRTGAAERPRIEGLVTGP